MTTMKAAVIHEAGGPEVLTLESRPVPVPKPGEVLIRVRAFGLNRSEMFTRQGLSPGVPFPRILGIEAVGTVAAAPGGEFSQGVTVATAMGGMGTAVRRQLRRTYLRAGRPSAGAFARICPGRCSAPSRRCCRPPGVRSSRHCAWHLAKACWCAAARPRSGSRPPPSPGRMASRWRRPPQSRQCRPAARQWRRDGLYRRGGHRRSGASDASGGIRQGARTRRCHGAEGFAALRPLARPCLHDWDGG